MKKLYLQRGDTIIEVLLSIAILSVILVGAYVSVNTSTLTLRDSQEHAEALTIAQSQVESLIAWYTNINNKSHSCPEATLGVICGNAQVSGTSNSSFCFNTADVPVSYNQCGVLSNAIAQGVTSTTNCLNAGHYCYKVAITSQPVTFPTINLGGGSSCTISNYNYNVDVTWPSLLVGNYNKSLSGSYSRVTLAYRPQARNIQC